MDGRGGGKEWRQGVEARVGGKRWSEGKEWREGVEERVKGNDRERGWMGGVEGRCGWKGSS